MEYNGYVEDLQKQLIVRGEDIEDDGKYGKQTHEANLRQLVKVEPVGVPTSPHFTLEEFKSGDGVQVPSKYYERVQKLMDVLEIVRKAAGNIPIIIRSGYRTKEYNDKVGGVAGSQHLLGTAVDIRSSRMSISALSEIAVKALEPKFFETGRKADLVRFSFGLKGYTNCHIDDGFAEGERDRPTFWLYH